MAVAVKQMERSFAHIGLNSCLWEERGEPPCIPQKLPYVKVFDETHGGSLAFVMRGRNLNRSEWGIPRGEKRV